MRLSAATAAALPQEVARPLYDRRAQKAGMVHLGIGAFHRAHQAVVIDDAMNAGARDWAITGVSLRSPSVAAQLNPQDGLYTLAVKSGAQTRYRLIGAVRQVLAAAQAPDAAVAALASPHTRLVTLTVTEKGYARTPDGALDTAVAEAAGLYPLLKRALAGRSAAGLGGLTFLSCDNLSGNGAQLARLLDDYLRDSDPGLADWTAANCTFPSSMVDRIVPATTDEDRALAGSALGLRDEGHVVTEPFSQWVVEDRFAADRPPLEAHGVQLVADVASYETAKLRMLNGAHSVLAYVGLARGHRFVHEAVADPGIRHLVERLMRDEAAPSIDAGPGQDLEAYAEALLTRFANSALNHRLDQIAADGSQKIPNRWLPVLAWSQRNGRECPALLTGVAAWLKHARGDNGRVDDPLAAELGAACRTAGREDLLSALLGEGGLVASAWRPDVHHVRYVGQALQRLERREAPSAGDLRRTGDTLPLD